MAEYSLHRPYQQLWITYIKYRSDSCTPGFDKTNVCREITSCAFVIEVRLRLLRIGRIFDGAKVSIVSIPFAFCWAFCAMRSRKHCYHWILPRNLNEIYVLNLVICKLLDASQIDFLHYSNHFCSRDASYKPVVIRLILRQTL